MNAYADGRLSSREARNLVSQIIRGKWNGYADLPKPPRRQTFAYHLHRLSLAFRDTKGSSEYCLAAESLFHAVIKHTDVLEHVDHRDWNAVGFLLRLCRYHTLWRESPESWKANDLHTLPYGSDRPILSRLNPDSFSKMRSLLRHTLGYFYMRGFWDSVWFGRLPGDCPPVDWYVHLSTGNNFRSISGLPVSLTKKAAHLMMEEAPIDITIFQAN